MSDSDRPIKTKTVPREDVKRVRTRLRELNRTEKEIYDAAQEEEKQPLLRELLENVGHLFFWAVVFGVVLSSIIVTQDFLIPLLGIIKEWLTSTL